MFYIYNSLVAFKIPPFPRQAEASFLRYSASASSKNSPPLSKKAIPVADPGEGPVVGGGRPPPPLILRPNWGLKGRNQFRIRGPTRFGKALNLIFPKLSSQNMRSFDHATILSYSFHGLRKKHLAQWPAFCFLLCPKNSGGLLRGCAARFLKPLPYFRAKSVIFSTLARPDQKFDTLFQTWCPGARRVTSCYGTYAVVGVNIKLKGKWSYRQMMKN